MNNYFKAVTLGAFTWKNEGRITLFFEQIKKAKAQWLLLHFLLLSLCLNFPVMFAIARLSPFELYSRLYGENFAETSPVEFNVLMYEGGFSMNTLLPLLGMALGLVLIIQLIFYLLAVFFLGLSRMNIAPLSFSCRLGLGLFSSTLPVLAASLFGFYLPTVHIIIFYFIVMFFIFQRSRLCPYPNG